MKTGLHHAPAALPLTADRSRRLPGVAPPLAPERQLRLLPAEMLLASNHSSLALKVTHPPYLPADASAQQQKEQPKPRRRRPQRTFWLLDPHPARPDRTKPESLGIEPLAENEESYLFETEIRFHLPVVTEIPDRADCRGGPRPCPLVSCASNNYVSRTPGGAAKLTFPHLEPWEVPKNLSCSLDIADRGATVKTVAKALNLTEERIRQLQVGAFKKLRTTRVGREWLRSVRGG